MKQDGYDIIKALKEAVHHAFNHTAKLRFGAYTREELCRILENRILIKERPSIIDLVKEYASCHARLCFQNTAIGDDEAAKRVLGEIEQRIRELES